MQNSFGSPMQGSKQYFGPRFNQIWLSWALLRYLGTIALLLMQSWGIFRANWAIRRSCSSYIEI